MGSSGYNTIHFIATSCLTLLVWYFPYVLLSATFCLRVVDRVKRHGQLAQRVSDLFVRNKAQGGHLENVFYFSYSWTVL